MKTTEFEKRYIAARRAAIALDFSHLNDVQREAVLTTEGALLLLAGAGSGKTTVLINRIANLLRYGRGSDSENVPDCATEDDLLFLEAYAAAAPPDDVQSRVRELCAIDTVEPWRIIAITFTNKAAGELKERLERMLGSGAEDIWAMTFHSACARMLRRDIDRLGYDRSFAIYDTSDTASLMKRILKEFEIEERDLPHKIVLGYISRAKDKMTSPEDFLSSAKNTGDARRVRIGQLYLEYAKRLKAANALDFDDLMLLAVRLLMECPDVAEHYQKRFKYVLIDEYQDTNYLQYLLASILSEGHGNICVVGDDDQSIYKFRGATIENILNFEKQFSDARLIRLEQNYRSTGHILDAAGDVIRNNKGRKGKKLWTEKDAGMRPALHIMFDEREEARFVADMISASASKGRNWCEHAVLYRINAQSNQLETAFKRAGVPYRVFGGTGFYDRAEIKDMLAYLCLIHNPHDDQRLLRVINNPPRGIGDTTVGRLTTLASELGISVFDAIRESQKRDVLASSAGRLHLFADMIDELRLIASESPLDVLYDALINKTGYIRMLETKGSDENQARIENVRELKTNIVSFMKDNGGSLFDFLSEVALYTDIDRDDQNTDRVLMMTMHSAKGLEFDTVFIVGAEEGLFPGSRTIGDLDEMEEERRLCYVAMTRAIRRLIFTSARSRMLFGKTTSSQPSRFVNEIDSKNLDVRFSYD
ncbi:MAG: UvrD-helicase domain-containing protein [Oscillospiraceae bacterium]|jgi:DNA helicase-2/ATP-dependent DNA helicase PcrA|nr:UvrD-helicase domain-containing protein [Oscillospiraceae bacterium]